VYRIGGNMKKEISDSEELKVFYKKYGYDITISSAPHLSPAESGTIHTSYNNNNYTHTNKNNKQQWRRTA